MLTAFTASLLLITVSELGDKTFFIAAILAMRHSRWFVLMGVIAALAVMTILSVLMGQTVSLLPDVYIDYAEIVLFFIFGIKLLVDASKMLANRSCEEQKEAAEVVEHHEEKSPKKLEGLAVLSEAFTLTFIAEWGDRTQITTIALAASNHPIGVTLGAIVGHSICAAIAVIGGCLIAGRISEKTITTLGGILFLIFATIATVELL